MAARVAPPVSALIEAADLSGDGGTTIDEGDLLGTLIAPVDLQCIKAAGVTFALSAVERVIEEKARGDWAEAALLRDRLEARVGQSVRAVVPGSNEAAALKRALIEDGMWSQYLEVAIGPDGAIGIREDSDWNNPEPEIALAVDSRGTIVGATLGNDVNLRDFEGRSALLLGKAKDNNASCALGPLIRLFDASFTIDHVRQAEVRLTVLGEDGYRLEGASNMAEISRDPLDLVAQTMSQHDYPDGFVLMCGTLFAPIEDRDEQGRGFPHKVGDLVTIESDRLGRLTNRVTTCRKAMPWHFGIGALIENLAGRGLL